jgi:hypothetical protein
MAGNAFHVPATCIKIAMPQMKRRVPQVDSDQTIVMTMIARTVLENESRARLLEIVKYLRYAERDGASQGSLKLGVLAVKPGGGGQIICELDMGPFVTDLATVLDAPDETKDDAENASARAFLDGLGVR